jgi:surface antigen
VLVRRLPLPATLVALSAMLGALLVAAPPAQATSSLLCQSFTGCKTAGYKNFGYAANYREMWWRMYAGHNCTNYVAYRMVRSGMSATRPWSGSGDARNWGVVFASKTNQTPMVGSVAWWSSNHVAYVQQIIDANTIIISEDHYGGDFDWRKIVRSGGGWPTGFIHLNDESLKATAVPTISGTPKVDTRLTASAGTWNIKGATYTYQWLANGVAIVGATGSAYTPTAKQFATKLSVKVTAARAGYRTGTSLSAVSVPVAPGTMTAVTTPVVSGIAKVAGTLTVSGGSWTPAASTTSISWLADGVVIPGASGPTLTLGAAQLGHRITAVVTGRRAGYTDGVLRSAPTAPVGPEKLSVTREPSLAGTPHLGQAVEVTPGVVGPVGVTTSYQWLRAGAVIPGATSARYVPTVTDLGTRLSVRVTYAKPGYTSIVRTLSLAAPVRTYPSIRVHSPEHRTVTVTIEAAGLSTVWGGTVTLVNVHGERRTRTLDHGEATFSPDWLRSGERTFTVIYSGSSRVEAKSTIRTITVK